VLIAIQVKVIKRLLSLPGAEAQGKVEPIPPPAGVR
jgi:hypothetical protein